MEADGVHSVVFLTPLSFFRIRIIFAEPKLQYIQYIPVKSKTQIGPMQKVLKKPDIVFFRSIVLN